MIIGQALYGATAAGHGLLRCSDGLADQARPLAWRMDLPSSVPAGAHWTDYVSGFPAGKHYVLARTLPDPEATRPGMVFSHALFLAKADVAKVTDLEELFARLNSRADPTLAVTSLEIDLGGTAPTVDPSVAGAIAEAWLADRSSPLVIDDPNRFEAILAIVWSRLGLGGRQKFSFRISFGPNDVENTQTDIVLSPPVLRARWPGYRFVNCADTAPISQAAAAFAGLPQGAAIARLAEALECSPESRRDFQLLARAANCLSDTSGTDPLFGAARAVSLLSASPERGSVFKRDLIERLANAVPKMAGVDILKFANLDTSAFGAMGVLDTALRRWSEGATTAPLTADADVLLTSLDPSANQGWSAAIWSGVNTIGQRRPGTLAAAYWLWSGHTPRLAEMLVDRLAGAGLNEETVLSATPESLPSEVEAIAESAAARVGWWSLHGRLVMLAYPPRDALRRQLAADPTRNPSGLRLASAGADGADLVQLALESADPTLAELAGDASARSPPLLARSDVKIETWRSIWTRACLLNPEAWSGPDDPALCFGELLDLVLDHAADCTDLLVALAPTPLANLLGNPRRSAVWEALPTEQLPTYLAATAAAWVTLHQATSSPDEPGLEAPLLTAVLASPALRNLEEAGDIATVLRIYSRLPEISEDQLIRWLPKRLAGTGRISAADAGDIAQFAMDRGWRAVAKQIVDAVNNGRYDLRPTLSIMAEQLPLSVRYAHGVGMSVDPWQVLLEIAVDLYSSGPAEGALWSRAGGHDGDLSHTPTGRERWRDLMVRSRSGSGSVDMASLLGVMRRDFPNNAVLTKLSSEPVFAPPPSPLESGWHWSRLWTW